MQTRTIAGVPSPDPEPETPFKPRFDPAWRDMVLDEKNDIPEWQACRRWSHVEKKRKDREADRIIKQREFDARVRVAERHADEVVFWYVWQADFRGRLYPLSDYLHPQDTDVGKALLTFADGRPMGPMGGKWLAIHLVNCMKKTPEGRRVSTMALSERVAWVYDREAVVAQVAEHPMDDLWWTECGEPLRFYAACCEWLRWVDSDYSEEFESSLPICMDGTNNGVQHFAAAWRDPEMAKLVNVTANAEPHDLYGDLAKLVVDRLSEDAIGASYGGDLWTEDFKPTPRLEGEMAKRWLASEWVDRSLVKRPGMTVGYGAKRQGFETQIRAYLSQEGLMEQAKDLFSFAESRNNKRTQVRAACIYLGRVIWEALEDLIPALFEHREWLQTCARMLAEQNKTVSWTVPGTGVRVSQLYYEWTAKRVKTRISGETVMPCSYEETDRVRSRKQIQSIAPNWVHSLDAAALMMTVHRCAAAGIESFSMNHDSYGVPAGDAEVMAHTLRQEFFRLYAEYDPARQFYEELQTQSPDELLPEPRVQGELDVSHVLASDYFFS